MLFLTAEQETLADRLHREHGVPLFIADALAQTQNRVEVGDCLETLAELPAGCGHLVYADPPFCDGRNHGEWDDRWPSLDAYLTWVEQLILALRRVAHPQGNLVFHCDWHASHHIRLLLDKHLGTHRFRNELVWHFEFGTGSQLQFRRQHQTLFWYSLGDTWTFNPQYEPARSAWAAQSGIERVVAGSVWSVPWVNTKERNGWPTQKPVALLERLIRACSNPGDLVLDPTCGSGTTLVAAKKLGRRWWGCDQHPKAVALAEQRLAAETAPLPGLAGG